MGLQDRDYYWEKYRDNEKLQTKNVIKNNSKSQRILLPLLSISVFWLSFDAYSERKPEEKVSVLKIEEPVYSASLKEDKASKIISLTADRQGHFRGEMLINNVKMPFLIDTGATRTVIPETFAKKANLPRGKTVITNTAGGKVPATQTHIDILKIGHVVIKDVKAQINPHLDEVLIGMNTLKYFQMTITDKELTLSANSKDLNYANAHISKQPTLVRKKTVIKKKVVCDEYNVCITSYSN